jgi:hypothetical protein
MKMSFLAASRTRFLIPHFLLLPLSSFLHFFCLVAVSSFSQVTLRS